MPPPRPQQLIPARITRRKQRIMAPLRGVLEETEHGAAGVADEDVARGGDGFEQGAAGVGHGEVGWGGGGGGGEGPEVDGLGAVGVCDF